ncbi:MAG: MFS transporter [Lachnospiraceae bacterium]|nr:MFS transporter [Lachnospiraceae bacterium]
MTKQIKECRNRYGVYLIITLISIQFYDAYSSELYSRIQSLYIKEFLLDGKGMSADKAIAYLSNLMIPCYLFIMLAPACRSLADKFGRKRMLMISVLGILMGSGICAFSTSIYIFLIGNMILNFSNSLDIHNFYIIEEIPKNQQGKMRGITGGIAALAAISIPVLRSMFVNAGSQGWRKLYGAVIVVGIVLIVMACFLLETKEYELKKEEQTYIKKGFPRDIKMQTKQLINNHKQMWKGRKIHLLLLFLYGIATAGVTFYNEPLLSFSGLPENILEKILLVQPGVCCIVLMLGGRMADRYGWKKVITGMVVLSMIGCLGFVGLKDNMNWWIVIGVCYGVMLGGYWSAYHLLEFLFIREATIHRRGEYSAVITYINGIGNAIGIGLFTVLLQLLPLQAIKLIIVIPVLLIVVYLLSKIKLVES